jgi:metal transporter CNNM
VSSGADVALYYLNGGLSVVLVLLGGLFAGLTLAWVPQRNIDVKTNFNDSFMGQDRVYLQVIAKSGNCKERRDAQKVLGILQRGRHWVLVSLLLGNVITNETLPVVLDREVKGGWFAVLASTFLIVVFGEIIPQSICAKYGLSVGAWSSRSSTTPQKSPARTNWA